jgi:ankyrin repeat protein
MLRSNGAPLDDISSDNEAKMTPMHWAASEGKIASIRFLLNNRQDINAQDSNQCTPLVIAAQYQQIEVVIYLIKKGADMSARDSNGDTVLHWAAYKGAVELIGLLLHFMPRELESEDIFGQVVFC